MLNSNRSANLSPLFKKPLLSGLSSNTTLKQNSLLNPLLLSSRKRTQNLQSAHDHVVQINALHNHNKGKYVLAAHIPWVHGSPEKIDGIIPDITVADNTGVTTIEVETVDSFLQAHSISQYKVLNRIGKAMVILAVPYGFDSDKLNRMKNEFYNLNFRNIVLTETYY